MKPIRCLLYEKLRSQKELSPEEVKTLMNVVRNEINFLIRNNILLTPVNYERWFYVFCYVYENRRELTDLEIFGLYKEVYGSEASFQTFSEEMRPNGYVEKLKVIASEIDEKLKEIVDTLTVYEENLDKHTEKLEKEKECLDKTNIEDLLSNILEELKEIKKENSTLKSEINHYHSEINRLKEELSVAKKEANVDHLTGLINRRRFERTLYTMLEDFHKRGYPFSIILLDLDDFKKINDTYGHAVGDEVLKEVASILKNYLRANTVISRIGGEEFAILLPGVELEDAVHIANRIRNLIANRTIRVNGYEIHITASLGVTQVQKDDNFNRIMERVDSLLYLSKRGGKNRVEVR